MMKLQLSKIKYGLWVAGISGIIIIAIIVIIPNISQLDLKAPHWCYNTEDDVYSVEISYNGLYYFAGTDEGLFLFQKSIASPIWEYNNINHVNCITISSDGKYLAAVDWDNLHVFSRVDNNQVIHCLNIPLDSWYCVDFSLNGEFFVAVNYRMLYLYSVNDFKPIWSFTSNEGMWRAEISADGSYIAAMDSRSLYFFSRSSNNTLWKYSLQLGDFSAHVAISANGEYIVYGESGSRLYLFHKDNPIPIWTTILSDYISCVDISYDGSYITAGCVDGIIYFFSYLMPNPLWTYSASWPINSISISSNGMYLAAISTIQYVHLLGQPPPPDGELYVFKTNPRILLLYYDFNTYVYSCDISSDGEEVLVGVSDGRFCLF